MLGSRPFIDIFRTKVTNLSLLYANSFPGRKTLVLDLDETLIHCNTQAGSGCDVSIPVTFPNGEVIKAPINLRPHVRQFLQEMASIFEVIVFTASHSCYADQVIDYLDPTRSLIRHRFYRESCI